MDLNVVANIAEIIGVILVVVTLIFLTLQIRQNTKAIRASTMKSALQSEMEFAEILLEHAEVWEKLLTAATIADGIETRKCILLYNIFMIDTEARFHQYNAGHLDAQGWEGRRASLKTFTRLPAYKLWRKSLGGMSRSAEYLNLLDNIAAGNSDEETK